MLLPLSAFSQEEAFYIGFNNETLADAFTEIEDTYNVLFSYKYAVGSNKTLKCTIFTKYLQYVLICNS